MEDTSAVTMPVGPTGTSMCGSCCRGFTLFRSKKTCGRCEREICSKCTVRCDSRIVGKRNAPKKKVCMSCNALITVPLMNSVALKCAAKSQLVRFLHLHSIDSNDETEMSELVRLCEEQVLRTNPTRASVHRFSVGQRNDGHRSMAMPRVEVIRLPNSSSDNNNSNNASNNTSNNTRSTDTSSSRAQSRSQSNNSSPTATSVDELIAAQVFRLLLSGTTTASGEINLGGMGEINLGGMGGLTDQTEEAYRQEQAELREKFKREQEDKKTASVLDNAKDETAFKDLRVADLKTILTAHFVDHSDCLEKSELLDKVIALWRSKNDESENLSEDALCTICCDNTVDCVFLECGHLTCCTECGSKMTDCPMCRKPITRCVHVFRK